MKESENEEENTKENNFQKSNPQIMEKENEWRMPLIHHLKNTGKIAGMLSKTRWQIWKKVEKWETTEEML